MNTILVFTSFLLSASLERDISAIRNYLVATSDCRRVESRTLAESADIERITDWPFLQRLKGHRMYSVKEGNSAHSKYAVLSVDDSGGVGEIDEVDDFNGVLEEEAIEIHTKPEALDVATAFLRSRYYTGIKLWGWELGVYVVKSVNDIPFEESELGREQARVLETMAKIDPPRIQVHGDRFVYSLFMWSPVSGNVDRMEIVMDSVKIIRLAIEPIGEGIGKYGMY